jgi:DnaK suppressor protein
MNKKLLQKFRTLLLKEKESVIAHLRELKGSSEQQLEQSAGDDVDIASSEITKAALQKLGAREQKHLQKIDEALEKIDSGEYGNCEMCGEEISPARLEARPVALYCIDCKTQQEQRERQYVDEDERDEDGWESADSEEAAE